MRKPILILVILFCAQNICLAQPAYFSHVKFNDPNYCSDLINKITSTDNQGNIYVTGEVRSSVDMDPGQGTVILNAGTGKTKAVLAKFNAAGGYEWGFLLGGNDTYGNYGDKLKVDPATGDILIRGVFQGGVADFDPGPGIFNLSSTGLAGFLARYTSSGNFVFAKIQALADFAIDGAGNIIIATRQFDDLSLLKLTPSGITLWQFHLSVPAVSTLSGPSGVTVDAAGNIIVVGEYSGNLDFDPGPGTTTIGSNGVFLAKYNSSGQFMFAKSINDNSNSSIVVNDITIDQTGNFTITGYIHGNDQIDLDPGPAVFNLVNQGALFTCGWDILLARYDNNGNFIWAFTVGSYAPSCSTMVGREEGKVITGDASGNLYITGTFSNNADFDPGPGTALLPSFGGNIRETFVAKYSASGQYLWAFKIGCTIAPQQYEILQVHGESLSINGAGNIVVGILFISTNPIDLDPSAFQTNLVTNPCTNYAVITYVDGKIWNGSLSTNWSDGNNWNGGSVPGAADNVLVPANAVVNEPALSGNSPGKNIYLQTGRTLTLNNGTSLTTGQFINNGTVINNGSLSASNSLFNPGTYKGVGSFTGPLFSNDQPGSIIEPGNSPGCMNFSGNFRNKGDIRLEVNGTNPCTDFDRLNVGGIATVGGKLLVNFGMTPTIGQSFLIINAAGYSGFFDLLKATPSYGIIFANGLLTVNAPLPVNLISFTGNIQQNNIQLNWKTTDASNLSHFVIERSVDGIQFLPVKQQPATNGSGEINYSAMDVNANAAGSKLYYRLKIVDIDGQLNHSKILLFRFEQKGIYISDIYPNPSKDIYTIVVSGNSTKPVVVTVIDLSGRQLLKQNFPGPGTYHLDLKHFSPGFYFLRTGENEIYRLIKQ